MAVAILAALADAACSDASSDALLKDKFGIDDGASSGASMSMTLAAGESATIVLSTGATLSLPSGALAQSVAISVSRPKDSEAAALVQGLRSEAVASAPYVITPHGTQFLKPVQIALPVASSAASRSLLVGYRASEQDPEWKVLGRATVVDGKANFTIPHLSVFVLLVDDGTFLVPDSSAPPADSGTALSDSGATLPSDSGMQQPPPPTADAGSTAPDAGTEEPSDAGTGATGEPDASEDAGGEDAGAAEDAGDAQDAGVADAGGITDAGSAEDGAVIEPPPPEADAGATPSVNVGAACLSASECQPGGTWKPGVACLIELTTVSGQRVPFYGYCSQECTADSDCGPGAGCPFADRMIFEWPQCLRECKADSDCPRKRDICSDARALVDMPDPSTASATKYCIPE